MRKTVLISLLVIAAQLFAFSEIAGGAGDSERSAPPAKKAQVKVPKGAIVKKNGASLKRGYRFVRVNDNTVQVQRMRNNAITGTFTCNCGGSGTCSLSIVPSGIFCVKKTCNAACQMTTTIEEFTRQ